jgi:hypothetical protein
MQTDANKKRGVVIMCLGALGFFFFFGYFHLSGAILDYKDIPLLLKMILTTAFLPAGLYVGLRFYGGNRLATQIGGGLTVFLVIGFILGFLLH